MSRFFTSVNPSLGWRNRGLTADALASERSRRRHPGARERSVDPDRRL